MGAGAPRRTPYPPESRARAVELARTSGLSPRQVADDLGVDPDTIRRWLRQVDIDAGRWPELPIRVAQQDPADGDGRLAVAMPQRQPARHVEGAHLAGIPAHFLQYPPRARIAELCARGRQARSFLGLPARCGGTGA